MLGILVISFGSSNDETREKNLDKLFSVVEKKYPEAKVLQAFSSGMVRDILRRRGISVPSLEEALAEMKDNGVNSVYVLPSHLLNGVEYEKIQGLLQEKAEDFQQIALGKPLLWDSSSQNAVLEILAERHKLSEGTALILMGHGSHHSVNTVYASLDYMAKQKGFPHIYVTTVEAYPDFHDMISLLEKSSYKTVHLVPLMLVAGEHALNDMISAQPDSLKSILEEKGYHVSYSLEGLGELSAIRALYLRNLEEILKCH